MQNSVSFKQKLNPVCVFDALFPYICFLRGPITIGGSYTSRQKNKIKGKQDTKETQPATGRWLTRQKLVPLADGLEDVDGVACLFLQKDLEVS